MARRAPSAFESLLGRLPPELQVLGARAAQELQNAAARGSSAMFQSYARDAKTLLERGIAKLDEIVVSIQSEPVNDGRIDAELEGEVETPKRGKRKKKGKKKR
jgi:hypothetical protein